MPFFNSHTRKAAIKSLLVRMIESPGGNGRSIADAVEKDRGRLNPCVLLRGDCSCGIAITPRFSSIKNNRSGLKGVRGISDWPGFCQNAAIDVSLRAKLQQRTFRNSFVTITDDADNAGNAGCVLRSDLRGWSHVRRAAVMIRKRSSNFWRISFASFGLRRLSIFVRCPASIAAIDLTRSLRDFALA
jgi:hypothetical protein